MILAEFVIHIHNYGSRLLLLVRDGVGLTLPTGFDQSLLGIQRFDFGVQVFELELTAAAINVVDMLPWRHIRHTIGSWLRVLYPLPLIFGEQ